MSQDMSEEEKATEKVTSYYYKLGTSAGMGVVAKALMDDALNAYKYGNDDLAKELRKKAKHWAAKAEEEHPGPPK